VLPLVQALPISKTSQNQLETYENAR